MKEFILKKKKEMFFLSILFLPTIIFLTLSSVSFESKMNYLFAAAIHLLYSLFIVCFVIVFLIMIRLIISYSNKFLIAICYLLIVLGIIGVVKFFLFRLFKINSIDELGKMLYLLYFYMGITINAYYFKEKWIVNEEN